MTNTNAWSLGGICFTQSINQSRNHVGHPMWRHLWIVAIVIMFISRIKLLTVPWFRESWFTSLTQTGTDYLIDLLTTRQLNSTIVWKNNFDFFSPRVSLFLYQLPCSSHVVASALSQLCEYWVWLSICCSTQCLYVALAFSLLSTGRLAQQRIHCCATLCGLIALNQAMRLPNQPDRYQPYGHLIHVIHSRIKQLQALTYSSHAPSKNYELTSRWPI